MACFRILNGCFILYTENFEYIINMWGPEDLSVLLKSVLCLGRRIQRRQQRSQEAKHSKVTKSNFQITHLSPALQCLCCCLIWAFIAISHLNYCNFYPVKQSSVPVPTSPLLSGWSSKITEELCSSALPVSLWLHVQSPPQVAAVHLPAAALLASLKLTRTTLRPLPPCMLMCQCLCSCCSSPWNTLPCVPKGWGNCFSCVPQHFISLLDMVFLVCCPLLYTMIFWGQGICHSSLYPH